MEDQTHNNLFQEDEERDNRVIISDNLNVQIVENNQSRSEENFRGIQKITTSMSVTSKNITTANYLNQNNQFITSQPLPQKEGKAGLEELEKKLLELERSTQGIKTSTSFQNNKLDLALGNPNQDFEGQRDSVLNNNRIDRNSANEIVYPEKQREISTEISRNSYNAQPTNQGRKSNKKVEGSPNEVIEFQTESPNFFRETEKTSNSEQSLHESGHPRKGSKKGKAEQAHLEGSKGNQESVIAQQVEDGSVERSSAFQEESQNNSRKGKLKNKQNQPVTSQMGQGIPPVYTQIKDGRAMQNEMSIGKDGEVSTKQGNSLQGSATPSDAYATPMGSNSGNREIEDQSQEGRNEIQSSEPLSKTKENNGKPKKNKKGAKQNQHPQTTPEHQDFAESQFQTGPSIAQHEGNLESKEKNRQLKKGQVNESRSERRNKDLTHEVIEEVVDSEGTENPQTAYPSGRPENNSQILSVYSRESYGVDEREQRRAHNRNTPRRQSENDFDENQDADSNRNHEILIHQVEENPVRLSKMSEEQAANFYEQRKNDIQKSIKKMSKNQKKQGKTQVFQNSVTPQQTNMIQANKEKRHLTQIKAEPKQDDFTGQRNVRTDGAGVNEHNAQWKENKKTTTIGTPSSRNQNFSEKKLVIEQKALNAQNQAESLNGKAKEKTQVTIGAANKTQKNNLEGYSQEEVFHAQSQETHVSQEKSGKRSNRIDNQITTQSSLNSGVTNAGQRKKKEVGNKLENDAPTKDKFNNEIQIARENIILRMENIEKALVTDSSSAPRTEKSLREGKRIEINSKVAKLQNQTDGTYSSPVRKVEAKNQQIAQQSYNNNKIANIERNNEEPAEKIKRSYNRDNAPQQHNPEVVERKSLQAFNPKSRDASLTQERKRQFPQKEIYEQPSDQTPSRMTGGRTQPQEKRNNNIQGSNVVDQSANKSRISDEIPAHSKYYENRAKKLEQSQSELEQSRRIETPSNNKRSAPQQMKPKRNYLPEEITNPRHAEAMKQRDVSGNPRLTETHKQREASINPKPVESVKQRETSENPRESKKGPFDHIEQMQRKEMKAEKPKIDWDASFEERNRMWVIRKNQRLAENERKFEHQEKLKCTFVPFADQETRVKTQSPDSFYKRNLEWSEKVKTENVMRGEKDIEEKSKREPRKPRQKVFPSNSIFLERQFNHRDLETLKKHCDANLPNAQSLKTYLEYEWNNERLQSEIQDIEELYGYVRSCIKAKLDKTANVSEDLSNAGQNQLNQRGRTSSFSYKHKEPTLRKNSLDASFGEMRMQSLKNIFFKNKAYQTSRDSRGVETS